MNSSDPKFSFDIVDQPSDAAPGSTVTENCKHDYNTITSEDVTFSPAATNREIKEVHEEEGWIIVSSDENDAQQRASTSSNQRRKIDYEFHEYQALRDQNQDSMIENVEARQALPMNQSSYLLLGSVQTEKQNENSIKAAAALSAEPVLKEAGKSPEALLHHGLHRRSLQLEDTPYTVVSLPAQSPSNSGGPISPLETPCTPIKGKETEKVQLSYPQNRNSTANIPKPSGIGLHLNSIINVLQTGSGAVVHTKSAQTFNFSIRGKKPTPKTDSHFSDTSKTSSVFTDDSGPEIHASEAVNSVTYLPIATINSSNNPEEDGHSAQGNKRLYTNIESDGISEDIKSNPKKKRKRSDSSDGDGDGCKRCHCKKSKCLKLYCDCFAAGLYCAGSCACQACYNRPEYEDKVLESRQQIELRNPLAFAPKIVKHSIEPPASISGEDETHFTPSSARHKRGCNCKKSMCLKKYCECYHANVGCSDGCRCEGCKNVFGIKGDYSLDMDTLSNEGITEITDASFLEMMPSGNGDLCHSQLTPRTPAVHFKKDVREGSLRPRQCFQSPESGVTFATPNAMTPLSPLISDNDAMILEASQEALNASPISELYYDNVETQGELKLSNPMQDDTPDILKESPATINAVKSSSPNKKRVSPPHVPRHEFGLRSLNGLRNGRKFILKAVPSIPPHTPSTDARRGGPQGKTGPQD